MMKMGKRMLAAMLIVLMLVTSAPLALDTNATELCYLEDIKQTASDRYTGNEGDSFIKKIGSRNKTEGVSGTNYEHGLEAWVARWNYSNEKSWVWAEYDLAKDYTELTGVLDFCHYSFDNWDYTKYPHVAQAEISVDGRTVFSQRLDASTQYPIDININVKNASILKIYVFDLEASSVGSSYLFGNMILRKGDSIRISSPTGLKVTATNTTALNLAWNQVSGATGYVVYQYNASAKKYTKLGATKKNSYKVTKLNPGTTYRFAVKAYKTVSGNNYFSKYSSLALATTKAAPMDTYTKEHYDFIVSNPSYNSRIVNYDFAADMASLKSTKEYHWDKLISLDYGNYYDVVLTDLMLQQQTDQKIQEVSEDFAGSAYAETVKSVGGYIKDLIDQYDNAHEFTGKIEKNAIDEFLTGELDTDSTSYKAIMGAFKKYPKAGDQLKTFLTGLDKLGKVADFIGSAKKIINTVVQTTNYIASINAYIACDQYFKQMFKSVENRIPSKGNYAGLKNTLNKYINASSSPKGYAREIFKACAKAGLKTVFEVFKTVYLKQTVSKLAHVCAGVSIGGVSLATQLSTAAGEISVAGVVSSVATGITLGVGISQLLTNADDLSKEMSMVVAVGELSRYVRPVMLQFAQVVKKQHSLKYAHLFDRAFSFYQDIQIYSYNHTIEALKVKKTSLLEKAINLFTKNRQLEYEADINTFREARDALRYIHCHKMNVENTEVKLSGDEFSYTGKPIQPTVKIAGRTLNKDFTVKYSNNTNVGVGKVTITGKGYYLKGSVTKTFIIVPRRPGGLKAVSVASDSVKLTWKQVPGAKGYIVWYGILGSKNAPMKVKTNQTSVTINNLKANTKYGFGVQAYSSINGKTYSSWWPGLTQLDKDAGVIAITTAKK